VRGVTVTGAAGFIGWHLVERLVAEGCSVRAVDCKPPVHAPLSADALVRADLRDPGAAQAAIADADTVFALAANMGGVGWTHAEPAAILHDNLLISANTLDACRRSGVRTLVLASSACVYPRRRQAHPDAPALREDEVFPADPDMEYGWEKLTAEILCGAYRDTYGLDAKIARLHGIYGPMCDYSGPRAKSMAALCAKVAAIDGEEGEVAVWGNGTQSRTYCYVEDAVEGLVRLASSPVREPLNIGSSERVSIDELVARIARTAGKRVRVRHQLDRPVGPLGRASDNTRCRALLGWEPSTLLDTGLPPTYKWIHGQVCAQQEMALDA
jgi:nucleoside-diphosphate-sugar epimerase